jgi:hypothetical protein
MLFAGATIAPAIALAEEDQAAASFGLKVIEFDVAERGSPAI